MLIACAALALAACGGDDDDDGETTPADAAATTPTTTTTTTTTATSGPLTHEEYLSEAEELCGTFQSELAGLGAALQAAGGFTTPEAVPVLEDAEAFYGDFADKVAALDPPEEDAAALAEFEAGLATAQELFADLVAAIQEGERAAIKDVADRVNSELSNFPALARDAGFGSCGGG